VRPLLFVDVDGVLNPYAGVACPAGFAEHDLFPGEEPVRLCADHGAWLHELAAMFPIDPAIGLARADVDTLVDWAETYIRSL
jgi:hypothetical protein